MNNNLLELKEGFDRSYRENPSPILPLVQTGSLRTFHLLNARSPLIKKHNAIIKRSIDIFFAILVITLVLFWLIPLLALIIKMDSRGPVFFLQKRNKRNGEPFYCIKFRTMVVNEEADLVTATPDDKRITGPGKYLRAIHLDELPQFINVLAGSMSVIGPRPHMITENIRFKGLIGFYNDRQLVKPGITGLAQSFGYHGPMTDLHHLNKKTAYDLFYITNWSFMMDIKILIRTAGMIFKKLKPAR